MTEEELQAILDEEEAYTTEWRNSLTQEQIDSMQELNKSYMKVIYMQQTLNLMSYGRAKEIEDLIASGQIKKTEQELIYLLTIIEDGDSGIQAQVQRS